MVICSKIWGGGAEKLPHLNITLEHPYNLPIMPIKLGLGSIYDDDDDDDDDDGHYLYPPFFPIQGLKRKKGPLRGHNLTPWYLFDMETTRYEKYRS